LIGGQSNLNASIFVNSIFEITDSEELANSKVLLDFSNHLYTNILICHKYCCELNKKEWLKLINRYTKIYLNQPNTLEPICLSKCVQIIIEKSCVYTSFYNTTRLISFFEFVFLNLK
jgi:hypothetical protein